MKILYLTQLYPPMLYGGGEYIFSKWAQEMANRGHTICVITQKVKGTKDHEVLNGVNVYRIPPEINYSGSLYSIGLTDNIGFLLAAIAKGRKISKGFDLLHSNTFVPTLAAEVICRTLKLPHLATIHDVYLQTDREFWKKWSSQNEVNFLSKNIGYLFEKLILKLPFSKVHTVSQTSKEDLIKAGMQPERILVIPNGVNIEEYRVSINKKPFQVCYIGRILFYKNLDTVIKAFKKVISNQPSSKFVIAGKGPYEQNLKELTSRLGLEKNIIFAGRISNREKVQLLAESQLMVQPSLVEGFGITVIESFCCGTPVVASNVMPLPELVKNGENGMTLPPFDENRWAEVLLEYLSNPQQCLTHGINGKKSVEKKYTITKIVDRLENVYQGIIQDYT